MNCRHHRPTEWYRLSHRPPRPSRPNLYDDRQYSAHEADACSLRWHLMLMASNFGRTFAMTCSARSNQLNCALNKITTRATTDHQEADCSVAARRRQLAKLYVEYYAKCWHQRKRGQRGADRISNWSYTRGTVLRRSSALSRGKPRLLVRSNTRSQSLDGGNRDRRLDAVHR